MKSSRGIAHVCRLRTKRIGNIGFSASKANLVRQLQLGIIIMSASKIQRWFDSPDVLLVPLAGNVSFAEGNKCGRENKASKLEEIDSAYGGSRPDPGSVPSNAPQRPGTTWVRALHTEHVPGSGTSSITASSLSSLTTEEWLHAQSYLNRNELRPSMKY